MVAESTQNAQENILYLVEEKNKLVPKKNYDIYMIADFWDNFRVTDPLALEYYSNVDHIHARLDKSKVEQDILDNHELYDICVEYFRGMVISGKRIYALTFFYYGFDNKFVHITLIDGQFEKLWGNTEGELKPHNVSVIPDNKEVLKISKTNSLV